MTNIRLYRDDKKQSDHLIRQAAAREELGRRDWRQLIMALLQYSIEARCPYCLQMAFCRLRIARLQDGREARDLCCGACMVGHTERLERGRMMLSPEELAEEREEWDYVPSSGMASMIADKFTKGELSDGQASKEDLGPKLGPTGLLRDDQSTNKRTEPATDFGVMRACADDATPSKWKLWSSRVRSFLANGES